MRIIDIHTHQHHRDEHFHLKSIRLGIDVIPPEEMISLGIHPWDIKNVSMPNLEPFLMANNVIFVGETGLDRIKKSNFDTQVKIFEEHVKIAKRIQKPLMIHNVRSTSDILQMIKKFRFKDPIIFHDFSGNKEMIQQCLKFNSYFSLGPTCFKFKEKLKFLLQNIPMQRLFLETDDGDYTFDEILDASSMILKLSKEELGKTLNQNFSTIFPNLKF